jgi:hypothetical protein
MERRHAHGARLAGCSDDRTVQEDVAGVAARFADCIHFGVSCNVSRQHDRIMGTRQNLPVTGDRAAEGALA